MPSCLFCLQHDKATCWKWPSFFLCNCWSKIVITPISIFFFSFYSFGKGAGKEMKLLLRCLRFATGPQGKVETLTRSIPSSGGYFFQSLLPIFGFVTFHLSVCIILASSLFKTLCNFLSHQAQDVCLWQIIHAVCLSVSPVSPPFYVLHLRIFSHPNVLPMLGACQSPPAPDPHIITHWMPYGSLYNVLHEGTSEYFCFGHKSLYLSSLQVVWRDLWFILTCHYVAAMFSGYGTSPIGWNLLLFVPHSSFCQTLWWTTHRQWSLHWTLLVEWPFCTRLNLWSLATISTAKVWW